MRTLLIASAGLALASTGAADAQQRIVAHGPGAGYGVPGQAMPTPPVVRPAPPRGPSAQRPRGNRWGSNVGGHWWGGVNAPGGWNGYRRPHRGWAVPAYWISPRFLIGDWSTYGLSQPPYGYNWSRYYDDAVLIDSRGSVFDTVNGVDWDRYGDGGYADDGNDAVYAGPDQRGYQDNYPADHRRPSNGVGGAVVGGAVGGVAGNVIAGRGNRLGGTLIGAGVGAVAGYAVDKSVTDHRRGPPPGGPGYGAPYPQPGYGAPHGYPPHGYPPRGYAPQGGPAWVSPDGATTVTTTNGGGYGGSTTTVVVQSAPVVTTTTTEYYEDAVTYSRPHAWHKKRVWRAKPRCKCH